jgi:hypothetical protein
MALTSTTLDRDISRRKRKLRITVIPSGNYTPGGDTFDLTAITNPKVIPLGKPSALPKFATVVNSPAGYSAEFVAGATMQTCKLKVFASPGNELAAAAYPAALLADANGFTVEMEGPLGGF